METAEESIAEFFQSSVYQRAELTTQEGKRIPFAVVLAGVVSRAKAREFKNLLKKLKFADQAPEFICLAPSVGNWLDGMKVGEPVAVAPSPGEPAHPLTQQINKASPNAATLVFLAGVDIYKPIIDKLKSDFTINAIDLSFSFFKLNNRLEIESLAQRFSLAMLAEQYKERLHATKAVNNVVLVGYSFGGFIALEVARMLEESGRRVPLVILLDTVKPESTRVRPAGKLKRHLTGLRQLGFKHLKVTLKNLSNRIKCRVASVIPNSPRFSLCDYFVDRELIRRRYSSSPYGGKTLLIRSSSREHYMPKEMDYGWRDKIPNLKIVKLAGSHNKFIREQHQEIVSAMTRAVANS